MRRKITSKDASAGSGAVRFNCWKVTFSRSAGATFQPVPERVKWLTSSCTGSPRFTSTWLNSPALARLIISVEMSVAWIWYRQPAGSACCSVMARLYGSCPLEQAADQTRTDRAAARVPTRWGTTTSVSAENGSRSRNQDVSLVVSASTTERCAAGSGRR